jgi:hypothetical protein
MKNEKIGFKEYLNEMPKYIDHDYLDFKPMESRSLSGLESSWEKINCINTKNKDSMIFINKRKTIAIIGLSKFSNETLSWQLEVATWIKLEKQDYNCYKVRSVHTYEDFRLLGYPYDLYISLYKAGIKLCSDNEQYQGAKPLWKAISRKIDIEVYNEETKEIIIDKYDERIYKDSDIWSSDNSKYNIVLRMK